MKVPATEENAYLTAKRMLEVGVFPTPTVINKALDIGGRQNHLNGRQT